jgi:UDP-N-acetylmuramoyl-tripeptide--D-alanyl-D-alanine ligase
VNAYPLPDLAKRLQGEVRGLDEEPPVITGFATDHRTVKTGDLFIAITGAKVDGHEFVSEAFAAGAAAALVERPVEGPHVQVPSVVEALARMASSFRDQFQGPVIGITGSAGKTTTKEYLAASLSPLGPILKTEGNRNTEYTAPLLWAELTEEHRAVVVEMAMRGFGQIAHLCSFSRPNISIITNIGWAHVEMVESREGIARAKSEILEGLPPDGVAVLPFDDEFLPHLRSKFGGKVVTFGRGEGADCRVLHYRALSMTESWMRVSMNGKEVEAKFPGVGWHTAVNAAAAISASVTAGVDLSAAASAIAQTQLPPMRMQMLSYRGAIIILDTYNASPPGVIAAIETLKELPCMGRRFAILGEMRELGRATMDMHREVGRALVKANLYKAMFYGMPMIFARQEVARAGAPDRYLPVATSLQDIRELIEVEVEPGDLVLIKGSRALEMEKALEGLPLTEVGQ